MEDILYSIISQINQIRDASDWSKSPDLIGLMIFVIDKRSWRNSLKNKSID